MSTRSTLARTLAGALAIAAFAAPAALARPADPDPPAGNTAAQVRGVQDLRSPDAQDAAAQAAQGTGGASARQPQRSVTADDGTPWTTIAAGLAALLIIGGSVTLAGRALRRTRRAGVAA